MEEEEVEGKRRQRVAVVGTGLAGLVTAFLLQRDARRRYDVHVFESGTEPSLDAASVSVPNARDGGEERIDVPMRAFTGGYYHNLKAMYDYLDVRYQVQPFLFHFARADSAASSAQYFTHASNNHRFPPTRPRSMSVLDYVLELAFVTVSYLWFTACCLAFPAEKATPEQACESLDAYVDRLWVPRRFVTHYLLPLMSAVTTCSHRALLDFPAHDVVEYKRLITTGKQYVVTEGVNRVQKTLTEGLPIRYSCRVISAERISTGILLKWEKDTAGALKLLYEESFDHVVFAVPPNVVAAVFRPLSTLSRIPTTPVRTIVHSDYSIVKDFDVTHAGEDFVGDEKPGSTGDGNVGQVQEIFLRTTTEGQGWTEAIHRHDSGAMVTSCPLQAVRPDKIIRAAQFTRVLRTPASRQLVNDIFDNTRHPRLEEKPTRWRNGDDNVWLVGSWCWDGMVLLEGCVVSAMRVANALGAEVPWRT